MVKLTSRKNDLNSNSSFDGMGSEKPIKTSRKSLGPVSLNPAKKKLEDSISFLKSHKGKKKDGVSNEKTPQIHRVKKKKSQIDVSTDSLEKNDIKIEDIQNAIKGVMKYRETNPKLKNQLFDERVPMFVQISLHRVPKGHPKLLRIPLRNKTLGPDDEICLIVPDVKDIKNSEHEKHVEHYENLLKSKGITNIKKIMTFHELRTENETFEQRRRLVDLYDIFLVDGRISGKVVSKCGKAFYKKRKVPTAIKIHVSNLQDHIEKALSKTIVNLHLKSASYSIQFGHTKMEFDKLVDNLIGVVEYLSNSFPGKFENIKSMHVFAPRSTSIPVYVSLESPGMLRVPSVKTKKPKAYKTYSGELTTQLNTKVIVQPSGQVTLRKIKDKSMHESPSGNKKSTISEDRGEDTSLGKSKKRKKTENGDEHSETTESTADKKKSKRKKAKSEEHVADAIMPSADHGKKKHKKMKTIAEVAESIDNANESDGNVSLDELKKHKENKIGVNNLETTESRADKKKHKQKKAKSEIVEVIDSSIYEEQDKKRKKKKAIDDESFDTTGQITSKERKMKTKLEKYTNSATVQRSLEEQQIATENIKPKKGKKLDSAKVFDSQFFDGNIEQTYSPIEKPKKRMKPIQGDDGTYPSTIELHNT
ncbi:unnamed protein product, partial [Callosobruchus maculatus]